MFSGIVHTNLPCLKEEPGDGVLRLTFQNPFKDLKEGGSVSVDGVCLTAEKLFKSQRKPLARFALGAETLRITKWKAGRLKGRRFNLEEAISLRSALGGGGLFSGHADGLAQAVQIQAKGECRELKLKIPQEERRFFWKKSSIALNGASLTVNSAKGAFLTALLVPKTLERTNLSCLREGDRAVFEAPWLNRLAVSAFRATQSGRR